MAKQKTFRCGVLLGLLAMSLVGVAQAAKPVKPVNSSGSGKDVELYRYVDDKGVTVIDRLGVPPEYVGKGYQVLNEQGRVIREVPPAPTPEEFKLRKAQEAQASSDAQLLRLYTSVDDVDRARERKLAELDGLSGVSKANLQSLKTQQDNLQAQAADQERAGRQVAAPLVEQLNNLKDQEQRLERDIARYQQLRAQANASFDADRARLAQLLGTAR